MFKITSDGLAVDDCNDAQVEASEFFDMNDPQARAKAGELEEKNAYRKTKMSPPGSLGLPALLDRRRIAYQITDGAFQCALIGDRVLVKQISDWKANKIGDTGLYAPETTLKGHQQSTSLGILVAAGPKALDILRSNGIDLGHRVRFMSHTPWRLIIDTVRGKDEVVLPMNCGDILGSEDLQAQLISGKSRVVYEAGEHRVERPDGSSSTAQVPWSSPDLI